MNPADHEPTTVANRGRTSSRLSNRTADEPQVEPGPRSGASSRKPSAAQPNEDAVSEASSSADSTAGRVKRQVSEIDSKESARLEKEASRELRRWDRESKLLRRASASDVATSTKMPRKSEPAGPSSSGGSLSSAQPHVQPPVAESAEDHASAGMREEVDGSADTGLGGDEALLSLALKADQSSKCLLAKPARPKNSEFNMKQATPEDVEGFRKPDLAEWASIVRFGAVEVLNKEAADLVRKKELHRILASCIVRRKKPMPGIGNFKYKSRWCALGHSDPDSGSFKTFSPMPSTEAISLFFQLTLCLRHCLRRRQVSVLSEHQA